MSVNRSLKQMYPYETLLDEEYKLSETKQRKLAAVADTDKLEKITKHCERTDEMGTQ